MDDLATLWKKTDKKALRMTWRGWGLYDDAKDREGVASALSEALIGAALVLWKRIREKGPLRGQKLDDAIEDALAAKWRGMAHRNRAAGADDTEVADRAGAALRRFLRDNPIASAEEGIGMHTLLRTLAEGASAGSFGDALSNASQDFINRIIADNKKTLEKFGCTARQEPGDTWWWMAIYKGKKNIAALGITPISRHSGCEFTIQNRDADVAMRDVHESKDADSVNLGYVGMMLGSFLSRHPACAAAGKR